MGRVFKIGEFMNESRYKIRENHLSSIKNIHGFEKWFNTIMFNTPFSFESSNVGVMIEDNYLLIVPNEVNEDKNQERLDFFRIPVDYIECYGIDGEKYRENRISGGGSGSINYGGAIVGAVLAGAPGMIIGGQRTVNEVKSELITHDERVTYINYFINNVRYRITFSLALHQYLLDMIPHKSDDIVYSKKKALLVNGEEKSKKDKLQELTDMLNEGLISNDDYESAKRDILGQ